MLLRRGQVGVWLFMAFLVLLIGVLMLVIFLNGRDPSPPVQNASVNITYFNVSILLTNISGVDTISYTLSNITWDVKGGFDGESCMNVSPFLSQEYVYNGTDGMGCPLVGKWIRGGVFVRGLFFPDKLEFYRGGVPENSTVLLEGFSDYYYFNSTVCNISRELFPCTLSLNRKAVDYNLSASRSLLLINVSDGILQKPIICIAYNYAISDIIVNLSPSKIPQDCHWKYDFCFDVGHDLSGVYRVPLEFHYNEFYNVPMNVSVLVRDFEISGYKNVGDRTVQIS